MTQTSKRPPRTPIEICMEAAKVTTDGLLNPQRRSVIHKDLCELQIAENLSNAVIAQVLRCSPSTYSQIRNGTYRGDIDKYLLRAQEWMRSRLDKATTPQTPYVPTSIGTAILAVCERAWARGRIGRVVTPSGCGKTAALQEYRRRNPSRTMYIQAGEALSTLSGVLHEIALAMSVHVAPSAPVSRVYPIIRGALAEYYAGGKGTSHLLIVDEATTLKPPAVNMLRNLSDDPSVCLAIILADTWRLDAEFAGQSMRHLAGGYEQLRSRMAAEYRFSDDDRVEQGDVVTVAQGVMRSLGYDVRLPKRAADFLTRLAQQPGHLRNVVRRIEDVADMAEKLRVTPTFSVSELDWVAVLNGQTPTLDPNHNPFEQPRQAAVA